MHNIPFSLTCFSRTLDYIEVICGFWCTIEFYFTSGQKKLIFEKNEIYIFLSSTSEIKFDLPLKSTNILFILCFYKE